MYVRFLVTKQVPNGLVRIKETSLNLKFYPYNIQYTNQTCKDFTQASEIHSELLFKHCSLCCRGTVKHCSSCSDTRGVTDTYNLQYQIFAQQPRESLDDCFARLESIVSSLCSGGPLAYSDNEHAKQLLYALYDHVWGIKSLL
jgi:hypothetical protein